MRRARLSAPGGRAIRNANAGAKALFDALNVIYDEREKRSFLRLNPLSLSFTAGALVLLVIGLIAIAVVPAAINTLGLLSVAERLAAVLRWPALALLASLALSLLYRYGPSRSAAQWRWLSLGSILAAGALDRRIAALFLVLLLIS